MNITEYEVVVVYLLVLFFWGLGDSIPNRLWDS